MLNIFCMVTWISSNTRETHESLRITVEELKVIIKREAANRALSRGTSSSRTRASPGRLTHGPDLGSGSRGGPAGLGGKGHPDIH